MRIVCITELTRVGLLVLVLVLTACSPRSGTGRRDTRFRLLEGSRTGIGFVNRVTYTEEYNTYTYRNFYNGAGVGIGDLNNDGLPDLYFCGNIADNRLYINAGDFRFRDVTEQAGVACPGVWSTGVSLADVNGDGWLDIYVCKSGDPNTANRHNELFINNGDLTFTESAAEYGMADFGLSTHASFFDYDRDGDLDCYLLNNSFQSVTGYDARPGQRMIRDTLGGNKLYRNDGSRFTDVSEQAGIYGSKIGFGLGVSVADLNRDGWMDLYISNDFFERDYLYINNQDGTFRESLEDRLREISLGAMGADMADINNDGYPEIFVTEMTAEGNARLKTKVLFEPWHIYRRKLADGYYHQFARNVLQLNNRNGTFSEIGRLSGVDATDWSWGALIMDLDNDGWRDLFVANGIFKDLLDRDYLDLYSDPSVMRSMIESDEQAILQLIEQIPSVRIPNYAYRNNADLTFTNLSGEWGLDTPSHSNGAAYGDLDNDGDLDLVINNVNMPPFVYRNETRGKPSSNYLSIRLKSHGMNRFAVGASVTLFYGDSLNYQEMIPVRGFKSCMDHRLHFGLGGTPSVDSLIVQWPDGSCSKQYKVGVNRHLVIGRPDTGADCGTAERPLPAPLFFKTGPPPGLEHRHVENGFSDFDRDPLLFHMISNEGPPMAWGDVNGDGREDVYVGGARDSPGAMYIQEGNGTFRPVNLELFRMDRVSEDAGCAFFDADGDGDADLYVASGSNEFPSSSSALKDRLYLNNGKGGFTRSPQALPSPAFVSSSCVNPADYDRDGDIDLFVGVRLRPFLYGVPASSYLLQNDGEGRFSDVTGEAAACLKEVGMVTGMAWGDVNGDGLPDMLVAGDWMPVKVFINEGHRFIDRSVQYGLSGTEGWWQVVEAADLDRDGDVDFVLGNHGLNSRFKASADRPVTMYVNDFDLNGRVEHIICAYNGGRSFPMVMKNDLVRQIPALESVYPTFAEYREETVEDLFPAEILERSVKLEARLLESCVLLNSGGSFEIRRLPHMAQFSPVYAAAAGDFDNDGITDLVIGGNQSRAKPETGIYTSSYGLLLKGTGRGGWESVPAIRSGIETTGEIRDLAFPVIFDRRVMVVARNNDILEFYEMK